MALVPEINVYFKLQAESIISRSERGNVVLIIRDAGDSSIGTKKYKSLAEFYEDESDYEKDNATAIKDVLSIRPYALYVIAIAKNAALTVALSMINGIVKTAWITVAGITTADNTALTNWIKAQESAHKSYKAVVHNHTANCKHVVNLVNTAVAYADGRETTAANTYTPTLAAIFARCNIKRGSTNYLCANLASVTEPADVSAAVEAGGLVLINDEDGKVRIAEGVNSMTTVDDDESEDMKLIEVVEGMDIIYDDIVNAFRKNFMGKYRNTRGNQYKFISDVNTYFMDLVRVGLLNDRVDNVCDIDVEAQRVAWENHGTDTTEWSDEDVKDRPFKRTMFLTGSVMMLQSIESLQFGIALN